MNVSTLEYIVIGVYLVFMLVIGWAFHAFNRDTGDYFRSGSRGSWWLCGASNYMAGTSAYTFTAAAGIAYLAGWSIWMVYLCGPVINILVYFFYAARCRQKRLTTPGEVMRERFNPATQQIYTMIGIITGFVGSGLVLYTLAIFVSAIFGLNPIAVIVVLGAVILFYSITGGRWAVMAADFLQCLIMFAMTILVSVLCLIRLGGIGGFFAKLRELGLDREYSFFKSAESFGGYYTYEWVAALFVVGLINSFSVANTNFVVKDGNEAKKSLMLSTVLSLVGCTFFFIPAFTARMLFPARVESLGMLACPADGAYAVSCLELLPAGMIGLIVVAMFAAAMSTMDTSLNGGASNFMLNVYPPLARICRWRKRSEKEMLILSRWYSLFSGLIAITLSIIYSRSGVGPLKVVLTAGALLGLPMAVPMFWGLLLKRMPQWTPIVAMAMGFASSLALFLAEVAGGVTIYYHQQVLINIAVPTAVVLVMMAFVRTNRAEFNDRVDAFFRRMNTPVDFEREVGRSNDAVQFKVLGFFSLAGGGFIMLLMLVAKSAAGVFAPLAVGGGIALFGAAMLAAARRRK